MIIHCAKYSKKYKVGVELEKEKIGGLSKLLKNVAVSLCHTQSSEVKLILRDVEKKGNAVFNLLNFKSVQEKYELIRYRIDKLMSGQSKDINLDESRVLDTSILDIDMNDNQSDQNESINMSSTNILTDISSPSPNRKEDILVLKNDIIDGRSDKSVQTSFEFIGSNLQGPSTKKIDPLQSNTEHTRKSVKQVLLPSSPPKDHVKMDNAILADLEEEGLNSDREQLYISPIKTSRPQLNKSNMSILGALDSSRSCDFSMYSIPNLKKEDLKITKRFWKPRYLHLAGVSGVFGSFAGD